jgi:hypothetical protein
MRHGRVDPFDPSSAPVRASMKRGNTSTGRRKDIPVVEQLSLNSVETVWMIGAAVAFVLGSLMGFLIGRAKDRPVAGLLLGGVLAVPGLVAISVMPKKEPAYY